MSIIYSQYSEESIVVFSPIPPNSIKLNQIQGCIRISWEDSASYEDGFVIEKKEVAGDWSVKYFSQSNRGFFNDHGQFVDGVDYSYRIRSYSILSNQKYFFSQPSSTEVITYSESSSSLLASSVSIGFGDTETFSISYTSG